MNYTFSNQVGIPGHAMQAQIFDEDGNHLANIKSRENADEATRLAALFSKSPEMKQMLEEALTTFYHNDAKGEELILKITELLNELK